MIELTKSEAGGNAGIYYPSLEVGALSVLPDRVISERFFPSIDSRELIP